MTNDHDDQLLQNEISIVAKDHDEQLQTTIIYNIGELSSKFEEFLAARSQFDSDHGIDFSAPTC